MGKIYGYVRVSTRGKGTNGNSLQAQREAVISHGANAKLIIEDVYTGTKCDRPGFNELLKLLSKGDTLIVTRLDRFARSATEAHNIINGLVDTGVTVDILNMGVCDNRPMNKTMRLVLLAFAELEAITIKERLSEGKAIARQSPDYTEGRPPKWTKKQYDHAMKELERQSYEEVFAMVGIPVPTLKVEKRRRKDAELKNGV